MVDQVLMDAQSLDKAELVSQENRSSEELDQCIGPCHTYSKSSKHFKKKQEHRPGSGSRTQSGNIQ